MAFAPSPQVEQAPPAEVKKPIAAPVADAAPQAPVAPKQESHPADVVVEIPEMKAVPEVAKDETLKKIEEILSSDQGDIFEGLGELERQTFIVKGEELALALRIDLQQAEVDIEKIDNAIKTWLSMVPGQNEFYIEQQALTKREQLLELREA